MTPSTPSDDRLARLRREVIARLCEALAEARITLEGFEQQLDAVRRADSEEVLRALLRGDTGPPSREDPTDPP